MLPTRVIRFGAMRAANSGIADSIKVTHFISLNCTDVLIYSLHIADFLTAWTDRLYIIITLYYSHY